MMRFEIGLVRRVLIASSSLAVAAAAAGCQQTEPISEPAITPKVAVTEQAQLEDAIEELAEQCGLDIDCEAGGIAVGRASVSGVPSVDDFFAAVINFQGKADLMMAVSQSKKLTLETAWAPGANAA